MLLRKEMAMWFGESRKCWYAITVPLPALTGHLRLRTVTENASFFPVSYFTFTPKLAPASLHKRDRLETQTQCAEISQRAFLHFFVNLTYHRRSQDFLWGALSLLEKVDDLF